MAVTVDEVLAGFAGSSRSERVLRSAFKITAVLNGLRSMAWVEVKWRPVVDGVIVRRLTCEHLNFYSATTMPQKDHDALLDAYCATRRKLSQAVERRVGKALGYLCPRPQKSGGGLGISWFYGDQLVSDDFEQTLASVDAKLVGRILQEKRKYEKVFGRVEFRLVMH